MVNKFMNPSRWGKDVPFSWKGGWARFGVSGVWRHRTHVSRLKSIFSLEGEICVTSRERVHFGKGEIGEGYVLITFLGEVSFHFTQDCYSHTRPDGSRYCEKSPELEPSSTGICWDEGWLVPAYAKGVSIYSPISIHGRHLEAQRLAKAAGLEFYTEINDYLRFGHIQVRDNPLRTSLSDIWPKK
jgi:hypothetical protein